MIKEVIEKVANKKALSPTRNDIKIVPNYLLTSSGSCHDFCKYGRKHAFEPKARRPIFSKLWRKNVIREEEAHGHADIRFGVLAKQRKKKMSSSTKLSAQKAEISGLSNKTTNEAEILSPVIQAMKTDEKSNAQHSFFSENREEVLFEEPVSLEPSSQLSSHRDSPLLTSSSIEGRKDSYDEEHLSMEELPKEPISMEMLKSSPVYGAERSPAEHVHVAEIVSRDHLVREIEGGNKMTESFSHFRTRTKNKGNSSTRIASNASGKPNVIKNRGNSPPLKPMLSKQKSLRSFKKTAPEIVRGNNLKYSAPLSQTFIALRSSKRPDGRRNDGSKVSDASDSTRVLDKVVLKPTIISHSSTRTSSVNVSPTMKRWKYEHTKKPAISEKPTTSLKTSWKKQETRPSYLSPTRHLTTTTSSSREENLKSKFAVLSEPVGFSARGTSRDNARLEAKPHMLKFRRGKVVDPDADQTNNAPRRVSFLQSRLSVESRAGKEASSSLRRRRKESFGEEKFSVRAAPAVVLRHRDRRDKKDTPGLFNQVIEETASKLVESRKSRVKALVGAFETVISLQENKVAPLLSV